MSTSTMYGVHITAEKANIGIQGSFSETRKVIIDEVQTVGCGLRIVMAKPSRAAHAAAPLGPVSVGFQHS